MPTEALDFGDESRFRARRQRRQAPNHTPLVLSLLFLGATVLAGALIVAVSVQPAAPPIALAVARQDPPPPKPAPQKVVAPPDPDPAPSFREMARRDAELEQQAAERERAVQRKIELVPGHRPDRVRALLSAVRAGQDVSMPISYPEMTLIASRPDLFDGPHYRAFCLELAGRVQTLRLFLNALPPPADHLDAVKLAFLRVPLAEHIRLINAAETINGTGARNLRDSVKETIRTYPDLFPGL